MHPQERHFTSLSPNDYIPQDNLGDSGPGLNMEWKATYRNQILPFPPPVIVPVCTRMLLVYLVIPS